MKKDEFRLLQALLYANVPRDHPLYDEMESIIRRESRQREMASQRYREQMKRWWKK